MDHEGNQSILRLLRFCGEEIYPVKVATWYLSEDKESYMNELWLEIKADYGTLLHEDTAYLKSNLHGS